MDEAAADTSDDLVEDDFDWEDWDCRPDEPLPCRTYHCDGTCDTCLAARREEQEYMAYLTDWEAEKLGVKQPRISER